MLDTEHERYIGGDPDGPSNVAWLRLGPEQWRQVGGGQLPSLSESQGTCAQCWRGCGAYMVQIMAQEHTDAESTQAVPSQHSQERVEEHIVDFFAEQAGGRGRVWDPVSGNNCGGDDGHSATNHFRIHC